MPSATAGKAAEGASDGANADGTTADADADGDAPKAAPKASSKFLGPGKREDLGDTDWVLLSNLPSRASWNKVRGVFAEIGCEVLEGKVIRAKAIAIVRLASTSQALKAEEEVQGKTFRDIPGEAIGATRILESERSEYES